MNPNWTFLISSRNFFLTLSEVVEAMRSESSVYLITVRAPSAICAPLRYVSTQLHQIRDGPRCNLVQSVPIELHTLGDLPCDACCFHAPFHKECLPPFAMICL